ARYGLPRRRAGPLQERCASDEARRVASVEEKNQGIRAARQTRRKMNRSVQFNRAGEAGSGKSGVAEVVFGAGNGERSGNARIRYNGAGRSKAGPNKNAQENCEMSLPVHGSSRLLVQNALVERAEVLAVARTVGAPAD